jgi:hypothetical protein
MSKSQRNKGASFEREVSNLLGVRRHLRCDWSESAPDIITDTLLVECKRRKTIAVMRFFEQARGYAERDPEGRIPVVFMREDRGELVVMLGAEDFLALMHRRED